MLVFKSDSQIESLVKSWNPMGTEGSYPAINVDITLGTKIQ
jgi:hypothetical protein